jgi:trehalose 6-phosphate phosphatase
MLSDVQTAIAGRPRDRRLVILSDFDGTLADFHPDPSAPGPRPGTARALAALAARADLSLGIVSGRRIADLRSRLDLPRTVYFSGLHGLEIEVGDRRWQHPELQARQRSVRELRDRLLALRDRVPGVIIEDKDVSVAVHVRGVAPERRDEILAAADEMGRELVASGVLRRAPGNMVIEFLPDIDANKGDAVRWIARDVATVWQQPPWIVFLGDDLTDEDAFRAIEDGVGVLVGSRERTHAAHRVADTADVGRLLAWLADRADAQPFTP